MQSGSTWACELEAHGHYASMKPKEMSLQKKNLGCLI